MYVAIDKNNTEYEFTWSEKDELIINKKVVNPNDYEIIEVDRNTLKK